MWTDFVAWCQSPAGARVLQSAVIPALAIIVAGVIAGLLGRAAVRSALARADREHAVAVVSGLVDAARATADPSAADEDRRSAARLRSEMDVRTRLLPLKGSDVAADWAATRIWSLEQAGEQPSPAELDDFRDRLITWTRTPKKARTLFTQPAAKAPAKAGKPAKESRRRGAEPEAPEAEAPAAQRPTGSSAPDRSPVEPSAAAADAAAQGPSAPQPDVPGEAHRTSAGRPAAVPATPAPADAAAEPVVADAAPSNASVAVAATPAWRRARAAADARAEHEQPQAEDAPPADDAALSTAPVVVQHQHRAGGAPAADADEAVRLEAHQLARRSRPGEAQEPAAAPAAGPASEPAKVAAPAAAVAPASAPAAAPGGRVSPAWLDTYDDEADVTGNLNLKTPPPVAAAAVRDRNRSGEDIVPRE